MLRGHCKNNEKQLYVNAKLHFNGVEQAYCSSYNGYVCQSNEFLNALKTSVISTVRAHGMDFGKTTCITRIVQTIQLAQNDDKPGAVPFTLTPAARSRVTREAVWRFQG